MHVQKTKKPVCRDYSNECVRTFRINIEKPRYGDDSYRCRLTHFMDITSPFHLLTKEKELNRCAAIVCNYRNRQKLPTCITVDELWKAKYTFDAAYHPQTGERMHIFGRMAMQTLINPLILGCLIFYYKSTTNTILWQWMYQSYNALVNYTNRSGNARISNTQLATSYIYATTAAIGTAVLLKKRMKCSPSKIRRLTPFAAVAAGHMINIPFMRAQELRHGLLIEDAKGRPLGHSKKCAQKAISAVVVSRIIMVTPGMVLTPFITRFLYLHGYFCSYPWAVLPATCGLMAASFLFMTPLACALFPQRYQVDVCQLEPKLRRKIFCMQNPPRDLYFNKGL